MLKSKQTLLIGGGGGWESNTASNVWTWWVGVFKQKTWVNLEFKKINAGSNKVTITDDTWNSEVDIDVVPTNFWLTKSDVGLSNVDNTSDVNKPISTATQTALDGKVDENVAITWATKTKITYDAKGLVTAWADATTADIADSTNKRYVTDAQLTVIGNTSGTNTWDNAVNTLYSWLVSNATHTGDVTGATALTIDKTAITGKTAVTAVGTDYVLISDTSDSGNLKKALVSDFWGGGSGTPWGADTQVQFNDGGVFWGDARFYFDKST